MLIHRYPALISGKLLRRYKRFLCDIEVQDGSIVTAYLANPGSMLGMCTRAADVRLSESNAERRKHRYTVEAIKIEDVWIGCNTMLANQVVGRLLRDHLLDKWIIDSVGEYNNVISEFKLGDSRFDFALFYEIESDKKLSKSHFSIIEVKTVTMSSDWFRVENAYPSVREPVKKIPAVCPPECETNAIALFPDCESKRAQKHLKHLADISKDHRVLLLYFVSRGDVSDVKPSPFCDKIYSEIYSLVKDQVKCISLFIDFRMEDPLNASLYLLQVKKNQFQTFL